MDELDTTKYLVKAEIKVDGYIEKSDVVGAVFGQTEGLLGDELELKNLQKSKKISRMDVSVTNSNGESKGTITIGSSLDKVETSVLAASLETIDKIGPCKADVSIEEVQDVRVATRKKVIERAKSILRDLNEETNLSTDHIIDEVRKESRKDRATRKSGHPAGPNVEESDALIIVEGRSDVMNLLGYGVKNIIAIEGSNVSPEIVELTKEKKTTAFLDADRGGTLILKELLQVADIDYVAFPPDNSCVEDLDKEEVMSALREKIPSEDAAIEVEVDDEHRDHREMVDEVLLLGSDGELVDRVLYQDLEGALNRENGEVEELMVPGYVGEEEVKLAASNGVSVVRCEEVGRDLMFTHDDVEIKTFSDK